jgi:hypothetical protein
MVGGGGERSKSLNTCGVGWRGEREKGEGIRKGDLGIISNIFMSEFFHEFDLSEDPLGVDRIVKGATDFFNGNFIAR